MQVSTEMATSNVGPSRIWRSMSALFISRRFVVETSAEDAMSRPTVLTGLRDHLAIRLHGVATWYSTDRKSTRLNSSHLVISYAVFCLKKKKRKHSLPPTTAMHMSNR